MPLGRLVRGYLKINVLYKTGVAFVLGVILGFLLWWYDARTGANVAGRIAPYLAPFGTILVNMLKTVVIPIVFFSLIEGASSLPLSKLGRVGGKVIGWYFATSFFAAIFGVTIALLINPAKGAVADWSKIAEAFGEQAASISAPSKGLVDVLVGMFANPFQALANGDFLPMIIFAILFGIALRRVIEATEEAKERERLEVLLDVIHGIVRGVYKIVYWILEYAPIGVFALTTLNFGLYGPLIVGPYVKTVIGIVAGILCMIFIVYSGLVTFAGKASPAEFFKGVREAMLTAFVIRSSAGTLPVTLKCAIENLKVRRELASFSLPLGATINMDGVCIHLPMWVALGAGLFGIKLTAGTLFAMVIMTVLASIGAGGVPGGSLMLLFLILGIAGFNPTQTTIVIALALGVNPILDMFETMNNVTGDLACTYVVAKTEGLIEE